jgi:uncharacterized protein (DUF3084 family)
VRAQLAGNDSQIEVRLGSQELGPRLKASLEALDRYKETPRGALITYVDYQGQNVVLGFSSGGKMAAGTDDDANSTADQATAASQHAVQATAATMTKPNVKNPKPSDKQPTKRSPDNKPANDNRARPRPTQNR